MKGEQEPQHEPATEGAVALGRFIGANMDLTRLALVKAETPMDNVPIPAYSPHEIREYLHRERYDRPVWSRPQPHATLTVYGKGYKNLASVNDNFMCQFGVFNLKDGGRLVQAGLYEYEESANIFEYTAMRSTMAELLGQDPAVKELEDIARISLGVIAADGSINPSRPFNQTAFGANLVPVLDKISSPAEEPGLTIQIRAGYIEQF